MNLKQVFNQLKQDINFSKLMAHAANLSYKDVLYSQKLDSGRTFSSDCSFVTGATYSENGNYALYFTKKFYKMALNKNITLELLQRLNSDLAYYYSLDSEKSDTKYLYSDILFLESIGLVEQVGTCYKIFNNSDDSFILVYEYQIIFNDTLYKLLFNYVFAVPVAVVLFVSQTFLVLVFVTLVLTIFCLYLLFFAVLSRFKPT